MGGELWELIRIKLEQFLQYEIQQPARRRTN